MTDKKTLVRLYTNILRIRIAEEMLCDIYPNGEMRTPAHFSIGQEAVSVGVCANLKKSDSVFASHRCHAAYLAKGGDLKGMTAELFGKVTGVCRGRAGSAHLSSPENNMFAAPILGAMIPVAVGAALSFRMSRTKNVAAVFFGDAAIEEGVFFESLNFSLVKKLPVLFVCENNLFSTHTHIKYRQPPEPIFKRVGGAGIRAYQLDGNDVLDVFERSGEYIDDIRKGRGPVFLECLTYRFREHVGPLFDFENPYRTKKEVMERIKLCPVKKIEDVIRAKNIMSDKALKQIEQDIRLEVNEAIEFARKSPVPGKEELLKYVS